MAIAKKGRKNVSLHSCPVAIIYYKIFSLLYDGFRDFLLQIGNQHRHTSQKYTINGYLIIKMSHSFFSRDSIVITLQVVRNKRKDVCMLFHNKCNKKLTFTILINRIYLLYYEYCMQHITFNEEDHHRDSIINECIKRQTKPHKFNIMNE